MNSSSIAVPTASGEGAEEETQDLSWIQLNYSEQDICQCAFNFTFLYFWFEEWIFAGCLWFQRFLFQNCWKTLGPHHIRKLFTLRLHRLNRGREVRSECRVGLEATKSKGKNSHWTASTPGLSPNPKWCLACPSADERKRELSVCEMQAEFVVTVLIDQCQSIHAVISHWLCCIPTAANGSTEHVCRCSPQAHLFFWPYHFCNQMLGLNTCIHFFSIHLLVELSFHWRGAWKASAWIKFSK